MHKVPDHLAIEAALTGITNCLASGDSINYIYILSFRLAIGGKV